ncbi:MAG: protein-disulfide reductase DsbD domain-containing protein [Rhizobiaceae bacterium]
MTYSTFLLTIACGLLAATQVQGAASDWQDIAGGRVRIIVAEPEPGQPDVSGMLQIDLAPGWKTYWRDPGDAGVPLQLNLDASVNGKLADLAYPAPMRFDDGVSVWAGYDAPVAIGLKLERPDTSKPLALSGQAFFGVCDKICVPVQFNFSLDVQDAPKTTLHRELVAMMLAGLPSDPSMGFKVEKAEIADRIVTIEASLPDAALAPELFIAAPSGLQFAAPVPIRFSEGKAVFMAELIYIKDGLEPSGQTTHYTLVQGRKSVSGTFDILQH